MLNSFYIRDSIREVPMHNNIQSWSDDDTVKKIGREKSHGWQVIGKEEQLWPGKNVSFWSNK